MKLLILSMLMTTTMAAPAAQSLTFNEDGSYGFYYDTGKEGGSHTRSEVRNPDGVVTGKFSYEDPDGDLREVNYRADETGFVAQGDVGVKGAPKGQFPVIQDEQPAPELSVSFTGEAVDDQPAEPKQEDNNQQHQEQSEPLVEATQNDPYPFEEEDKGDMQDLALEESSSDDPPEAFPPGFFLQKFHGLRRLLEPTKEDKPAITTEAPKVGKKPTQSENKDETQEEKKVPEGSTAPGHAPVEGTVFSFGPMKPPFPVPAIPHQEWASAMFHQPVYVFAYHQPDSYGYHYFF